MRYITNRHKHHLAVAKLRGGFNSPGRRAAIRNMPLPIPANKPGVQAYRKRTTP